ncbi:LysM peptidoglycan-binding domain-containing protein [Nocardioides marmoribigeumensis]|uniref:Bacterial transcriptional activator domain-containing protein n=1 Tax=Nocardioides marmoribigeumensis TaxID=433649 RepID=A0ABU2BXL5_9ACTN|nr:LysM peptidoglycan-binding domain-containing protein [Nocardioides marmoribigeumensis]MDR7363129.1 hypothetical protein [Nocardioides marmoribigeumensis]
MRTTAPDRPRGRTQVRPDTLPRGGAAPRRRTGTALLAVLGALLLVVGVPVGLVLGVGNPLPTTAPSTAWLTADLTPMLVIKVLAAVVWVAWAHFVVCFLTEWRAFRSGRVPRQVLLGGGSQSLARQLVASILLLAGGATLAGGVTALGADHEPARPSAPVVQVMDQQVVVDALGQAQAQVDADQAAHVDLAPGQHLKHYEVRPPQGRNHDTLWDIAERTMGDPFRYKEIFELNKDRLQPDGSRLTDADLIRPGWQLRLPGDAKGPGVRSTPAPTPDRGPGTTAATAGAEGGAAAQAGGSATQQASQPGGGSFVAPEQDRAGALGSLLLGGGLVLAGVARALTARRGPFGEPDPDALDVTRAAALRRSQLVDDALRGLAETRLAHSQRMPEVLFAYVDDRQVVLHLARSVPADEAPAAPWSVSEDGLSWTVHADEVTPPNQGAPAPYPCLVNVAESHGFDLLVDLEMAPGLVAIGGSAEIAREVVMAMALELATHAWADRVSVVMAGFGDELADLNRSGVRHVSGLDEALEEARRGRERVSRVAAELGVEGVLQGRQRGAASDAPPVVVFASGTPTAEQAREIAELSGNGRTAVSVVCVGDTPSARWRFVVDGAGAFDGGVLGVRGTARRLTGEGQARIHALLEEALRRRVEGEFEAGSVSPADVADDAAVRPVAPSPAPDDPGAGRSGSPVRIQLLGQVEVVAPGHLDPARREMLTELVVMAALHPEGLHEAVLVSGLWPRGAERDVVDARLADAQEWLGRDAEGRPRLSLDADGRWHLHPEVETDYAALSAAARAEGAGELAALLAGLRHGRGEAFSGVHYSWLTFAREARTCRMLVTSMARRAADLAVAAGRVEQAEEALVMGLRLVPTAEPLWRDRLRVLATHAPDRLDPAITEMYSVLDEHGVRHAPETDALVAELAPGSRGAIGG